MLDPAFRRIIDGPLDRIGAALASRGVHPDTVSFVGFGFGVGAALALAFRLDGLAALLVLANRLCDGLDGAVARSAGASDLGGYYDIVLDFLFYSGIVFAFAVGRPEAALPAAFLIFSFVGTGASFLAYAVMAAKRQMTTDLRGAKSLYYLGGLAEGTETIIVLVAICLLPEAFAWIAYGFGALCWATTAGRILAARRAFGGSGRAQRKEAPAYPVFGSGASGLGAPGGQGTGPTGGGPDVGAPRARGAPIGRDPTAAAKDKRQGR